MDGWMERKKEFHSALEWIGIRDREVIISVEVK
jgi:hypothetical protein